MSSGPNFELENPSQCGTLYGSYLWAYRAEGGQESCQECHMKKSKLGHNMQSYSDINMGKMAIDFRVVARLGVRIDEDVLNDLLCHFIRCFRDLGKMALHTDHKALEEREKSVSKLSEVSINCLDNGLPPNKPVQEKFEIPFPAEFTKKDGKDVTNILDYDMTVDIELTYEPFGDRETGVTWHKVTKKVSIEKGGV